MGDGGEDSRGREVPSQYPNYTHGSEEILVCQEITKRLRLLQCEVNVKAGKDVRMERSRTNHMWS